MVSRKISQSSSDFPASFASEAVLKSKEAGAVAAFDRVPFSYLSANFTFNTDNCVSFVGDTNHIYRVVASFSNYECRFVNIFCT